MAEPAPGSAELYNLGWFPRLSSHGTPIAPDDDEPVLYPSRFAREKTSGPERLLLTTSGSGVDLLVKLASVLTGDILVLYVLVVPRASERKPGRYQSEAFEHEDALRFLRSFRDFFDRDGRHGIWLYSPSSGAQLVYDRHNRVYAYGPLADFEAVAVDAGLKPDPVPSVPSPHCHRYHEQFDAEEERLFTEGTWYWSPLVEGQDDD